MSVLDPGAFIQMSVLDPSAFIQMSVLDPGHLFECRFSFQGIRAVAHATV
jgi:hypothetical protein